MLSVLNRENETRTGFILGSLNQLWDLFFSVWLKKVYDWFKRKPFYFAVNLKGFLVMGLR